MKADHAVKESAMGKALITCSLNGEPISLDQAQKIIVKKAVNMAIIKLRRLEMQRVGGLHGKEKVPI